MAITIEVNGTRYSNLISARIEEQLDALCNTFTVDFVTTNNTPLPFTGGEACVMYVDDVKKLTGFIEIVDVNYDDKTHSIRCQGRDKTGDIVDSTLEASKDISGASSLSSVCEAVISQIGADIDVVDISLIPNFNEAEDVIAIEPAQNAFDFLQGLANKRQVLLTSNGDGNLVLKQSVANTTAASLQNKIDAPKDDNNILKASVRYDTTERFNLYKATSGTNPIALLFAGLVDLNTIVESKASVVDDQIRTGRQYVFKPETSSSDGQCEPRSRWELNMRKARGITYTATVNGHTIATNNPNVWETDTLIMVLDEFCAVRDFMLLNKVTFTTDLDTGDQSILELVHKNSYTLTIAEPENEVGILGAGIFDFLTESP